MDEPINPLFLMHNRTLKIHLAMPGETKVLCGNVVIRAPTLSEVGAEDYDQPMANRCHVCQNTYQVNYNRSFK